MRLPPRSTRTDSRVPYTTLCRSMLGLHRVEVDRGDRLAFARDIQMIVDRDDGRKAGIFPEQSLGPGDHVILGRHFEPDVEEAIAARLEDLRAVAAAVERADLH